MPDTGVGILYIESNIHAFMEQMPSLVPHPSPLKHVFMYKCSDSQSEPCKPSPQPFSPPTPTLVLGSWAAGRKARAFAKVL